MDMLSSSASTKTGQTPPLPHYSTARLLNLLISFAGITPLRYQQITLKYQAGVNSLVAFLSGVLPSGWLGRKGEKGKLLLSLELLLGEKEKRRKGMAPAVPGAPVFALAGHRAHTLSVEQGLWLMPHSQLMHQLKTTFIP